MSLEELKKAIKEQEMTYGTKETLKNLKSGKAKVVFLASNAPAGVVEDIRNYAGLSGAKIVELDVPDGEIGIICKKRHSISVLSY